MTAVTVLMAVYDGETYLQEALDSILNQTLDDFELLVVDDGSSDGSGAILAACADPRLRVLRNDRNMGLSLSLNRGLREAVGRYVARIDADDLSEPERLAKQVARLDASPEIMLLGSAYYDVDETGAVTGTTMLPCDHAEIAWALLFYCPFAHSALTFRREELLSEVGFYDESLSYSMDYDLCFRTSLRHRLANLSKPLIRYRSHGQSITSTYNDKVLEGYRMRVTNVANMLGWTGLDPTEQSRRFDLLFAFLRTDKQDFAVDDLKDIVTWLNKLESAFPLRFGLSAEECVPHRAALRRWVAQRLRLSARNAAAVGERSDALRALALSYRAAPSAFFEPRSIRDVARVGRRMARSSGRRKDATA